MYAHTHTHKHTACTTHTEHAIHSTHNTHSMHNTQSTHNTHTHTQLALIAWALLWSTTKCGQPNNKNIRKKSIYLITEETTNITVGLVAEKLYVATNVL